MLALVDIPWLQPNDAQTFTGRIEEWPLWDVLMWLHLSHRTARVEVSAEQGRARVDMVGGQIQRCECAGMNGVAALDSLIHWDRGIFDVMEADLVDGERNIMVGTEQILFGVLRAGGEVPPAPDVKE